MQSLVKSMQFFGNKLGLFSIILISALIIFSCSDNPSNPNSEPEPEPDPNPNPGPEVTVGNLEVTTITSGLDPNPRGYTIAIENAENMDADPNDTVTYEDLEQGMYSVELSDVEDHCTVETENPVSVEIIAEETAEVNFEVSCKGIFREKIVFFRGQSQNAKSGNAMAMQSYYTMNYDGSKIEKVSDFDLSGSINFASDISPDGTKMVVTYSENSGRDSQIAIVDAYTKELIFLNEVTEGTSYFYPEFSPDGSKIAYIKQSDSFKKKDIYVMDSDGSNVVQVTNSDELEETVDWSTDGEKIIYHRSSDDYKYQGIFTINKDGTGEQLIIDSDLEFQNPTWSPNGNKIAMIGSLEDPYHYQEIYIMNSDGSNVQKVVSKMEEAIYYGNLQWSPDGSKISFLSNRDGEFHEEFGYAYAAMDIFMMDADGSNLENLTNTKDSGESNLMLSP